MKKYIGTICVITGVIILRYLEKLFFNWDFSFYDSLLVGICGAFGYFLVARNKEKKEKAKKEKVD